MVHVVTMYRIEKLQAKQLCRSAISRSKSQHYGAVKPSFLLLVLISQDVGVTGLEADLTLQLFRCHSWPHRPHFLPYPARDDWPVPFPQSPMLWILPSSSDGQLCCTGLRCTDGRQKDKVALGQSSIFMSLLHKEALSLSRCYLWERSSVLGSLARSWRKLEVRKDFNRSRIHDGLLGILFLASWFSDYK